jgi:hypothetical protein
MLANKSEIAEHYTPVSMEDGTFVDNETEYAKKHASTVWPCRLPERDGHPYVYVKTISLALKPVASEARPSETQ